MFSKILKNKVLLTVLVLLVVGAAVYLYIDMTKNNHEETPELNTNDNVAQEQNEDDEMEEAFAATEAFQNPSEELQVSDPAVVEPAPTNNTNQLPSECYPKDVLTSADLLPRDANSLHAQVVPAGQGALSDQNFLTAGYHIGINTVGQTLRNANRQLRSEPPNPQQQVSVWMQSTIEPDINRRPLEIGGQ